MSPAWTTPTPSAMVNVTRRRRSPASLPARGGICATAPSKATACSSVPKIVE